MRPSILYFFILTVLAFNVMFLEFFKNFSSLHDFVVLIFLRRVEIFMNQEATTLKFCSLVVFKETFINFGVFLKAIFLQLHTMFLLLTLVQVCTQSNVTCGRRYSNFNKCIRPSWHISTRNVKMWLSH